jgi:trimeric autotransporter adhesin
MKKHLLLAGVLLCYQIAFTQNVAINNDGSTPNSSAILDVKSTTGGFLMPRMTTLQRNAIAAPAEGLKVYDTDTKTFWFYDGSAWKSASVTAPTATNFRFFASTSQLIIKNIGTKIDFGTQSFLNNAGFSNSSFTAPSAGIYNFSVYLSIFGNNAGSLNVSLLVNNVAKASPTYNIIFQVFQDVGFSDNVALAAGDVVIIKATPSADMATVVGQGTFFTGFKIN